MKLPVLTISPTPNRPKKCSVKLSSHRNIASTTRTADIDERIAIQRGLAECSDIVHERLTKYRTAWGKKISNKSLLEIVKLLELKMTK